jgi:hypothetical protein
MPFRLSIYSQRHVSGRSVSSSAGNIAAWLLWSSWVTPHVILSCEHKGGTAMLGMAARPFGWITCHQLYSPVIC